MGYTPPFLQKLGFDQTESVTVPPGSGDVVGPASATDGHLVVFDGTTGKLVKDGGAVPTGGAALPDQTGNAGKYLKTDGSAVSWAEVVGGTTSSPAYFLKETTSATTTYSGTNTTTDDPADTGWSLVKEVVTGNTRDTLEIYTATDSWTGKASATYTLEKSYSLI